jgi:uncharacterized protein
VTRAQDFLVGSRTKIRVGECDNLAFKRWFMTVVKCPSCGKDVVYEENEFRPFCSRRCQLLDFGAWADEQYSLPAESSSPSEEEIAEIEKALEEKAKNDPA